MAHPWTAVVAANRPNPRAEFAAGAGHPAGVHRLSWRCASRGALHRQDDPRHRVAGPRPADPAAAPLGRRLRAAADTRPPGRSGSAAARPDPVPLLPGADARGLARGAALAVAARASDKSPVVTEAAKIESAKDAGRPHTQVVRGRPRTRAGEDLQP